MQSISEALMRNGNNDLTSILLSLIEFMEHEDKSLPLDNGVLGDIAIQAQIPAKALHWKELELFDRKTDVVVEQLVGINTQLQLFDTAWGILDSHTGSQNSKLQLDPWYEKLGRWQEALNTYEQRAMEQPESQEILLGRLRCLYALGEWESLSGTVEDFWPNASEEQRQEVAPLAVAASWALLQWDAMDEYADAMKIELPDRAFYRAILAVHRNQFQKAHASIAQARDLLQAELVANEDYTRSYPYVISSCCSLKPTFRIGKCFVFFFSLNWRKLSITRGMQTSPTSRPLCVKLGRRGSGLTRLGENYCLQFTGCKVVRRTSTYGRKYCSCATWS